MLPPSIAEECKDGSVHQGLLLWRNYHGSTRDYTVWVVCSSELLAAERENDKHAHDSPGEVLIIFLKLLHVWVIISVYNYWEVVPLLSWSNGHQIADPWIVGPFLVELSCFLVESIKSATRDGLELHIF